MFINSTSKILYFFKEASGIISFCNLSQFDLTWKMIDWWFKISSKTHNSITEFPDVEFPRMLIELLKWHLFPFFVLPYLELEVGEYLIKPY